MVVAAWVLAPPPVGNHAFAVSGACSAAQHDCVIDQDDGGVIADVRAHSVSLACQGLAVPISFPATRGWSLDPIASLLGSPVVPDSFQTRGGISETYPLVFDRAASVLARVASAVRGIDGDQVDNSAFAAVHA